jgi:hypothetical protein
MDEPAEWDMWGLQKSQEQNPKSENTMDNEFQE